MTTVTPVSNEEFAGYVDSRTAQHRELARLIEGMRAIGVIGKLALGADDLTAMTRDLVIPVQPLDNGHCTGLAMQLFTTSLVLIEPDYAARAARYDLGYCRRFCYEHGVDAMLAAIAWDGASDPQGPWVKEKSSPPFAYDRLNPALAREDFGE